MEKLTFYERLGLPRDATADEIRHAYREMARRLHPDKNSKPGETELFIGVQEAYEILVDPGKKATYDGHLSTEPAVYFPISKSISYSRNSVVRLTEPQLIYVLFDLKSHQMDGVVSTPPLNISLVLDCSTSMQGVRLDTVKLTAIDLIRQLKQEDILSVIKFSDKAEVLVPAGSISSHSDIESKIQLLHAGGGTEIYQGLDAGYSEVLRYHSKNYVNHIILITDGRTYGDEENCLKLVDQAIYHSIGISTLGIGGQWNDSFLDLLSSRTGGNCKFVSHTNDLSHYLLDKIASLGRSYIEQVAFEFQTSPGVVLNYAFRLKPEATPLATATPLILGAIPKGDNQTLLLEFLVNEIPTESSRLTLAKGFLTCEVPGRSEKQKFTERLELWRPVTQDFDNDHPSSTIIQALSRLSLYRMQERARVDLQSGKVNEATQRLQSLATHLLAQGHNELARAVLSEVVHIQQTRVFSEEGEKRIKYGTRSLLLTTETEEKQ
jgi:Ca-activated chloride channel family protein